jgi:effector-binding domain-containing protein
MTWAANAWPTNAWPTNAWATNGSAAPAPKGADRAGKENLMPSRLSPRAGAALTIRVAIAVLASAFAAGSFAPSAFAQTAAPQPPAAAPAQTAPAQTAPAAPAPALAPAATPAPASGSSEASPSGDVFGQNTALTAKTIIYVKGSGTWDKAFETITAAFKKIDAYLGKEGIKTNGLPMTIFTATDDTGFEYQAAVPIVAAPKNPPHGEMAIGQSPEGTALKFVHRGSYDDLDNTYEAITNYLDDKKLEAKDMFIEEYVTDPVKSDAGKLIINVYVLIKPQTAPG